MTYRNMGRITARMKMGTSDAIKVGTQVSQM